MEGLAVSSRSNYWGQDRKSRVQNNVCGNDGQLCQVVFFPFLGEKQKTYALENNLK